MYYLCPFPKYSPHTKSGWSYSVSNAVGRMHCAVHRRAARPHPARCALLAEPPGSDCTGSFLLRAHCRIRRTGGAIRYLALVWSSQHFFLKSPVVQISTCALSIEFLCAIFKHYRLQIDIIWIILCSKNGWHSVFWRSILFAQTLR